MEYARMKIKLSLRHDNPQKSLLLMRRIWYQSRN